MADDGISSISGRSTGVSTTRPSYGAGGGVSRAGRLNQSAIAPVSGASSAQRQTVNLDGKTLDLKAPRGTYLNLLA